LSGGVEVPAAAASSAPRVELPAPRLLGVDGFTRLRFGSFTPTGDIDALDTGLHADLAFGSNLLPFLGVEASLGYISAEGSNGQELTAVPLFLSGRLELPILVFEAYAGLGVGGMFADWQVAGSNDSDFLLASTGFLGAEVGLGDLNIGLEYRYLTSEEADNGPTIEGHSAMLSLTLPF
jgi:hypothetical protein